MGFCASKQSKIAKLGVKKIFKRFLRGYRSLLAFLLLIVKEVLSVFGFSAKSPPKRTF